MPLICETDVEPSSERLNPCVCLVRKPLPPCVPLPPSPSRGFWAFNFCNFNLTLTSCRVKLRAQKQQHQAGQSRHRAKSDRQPKRTFQLTIGKRRAKMDKRITMPARAVADKKYIYKNTNVGKPVIVCGVSRIDCQWWVFSLMTEGGGCGGSPLAQGAYATSRVQNKELTTTI